MHIGAGSLTEGIGGCFIYGESSWSQLGANASLHPMFTSIRLLAARHLSVLHERNASSRLAARHHHRSMLEWVST